MNALRIAVILAWSGLVVLYIDEDWWLAAGSALVMLLATVTAVTDWRRTRQ